MNCMRVFPEEIWPFADKQILLSFGSKGNIPVTLYETNINNFLINNVLLN